MLGNNLYLYLAILFSSCYPSFYSNSDKKWCRQDTGANEECISITSGYDECKTTFKIPMVGEKTKKDKNALLIIPQCSTYEEAVNLCKSKNMRLQSDFSSEGNQIISSKACAEQNEYIWRNVIKRKGNWGKEFTRVTRPDETYFVPKSPDENWIEWTDDGNSECSVWTGIDESKSYPCNKRAKVICRDYGSYCTGFAINFTIRKKDVNEDIPAGRSILADHSDAYKCFTSHEDARIMPTYSTTLICPDNRRYDNTCENYYSKLPYSCAMLELQTVPNSESQCNLTCTPKFAAGYFNFVKSVDLVKVNAPVLQIYFKISGEWTPWNAWTLCSNSNWSGNIVRSRICKHYYPTMGGQPCIGDSREMEKCTVGIWTPWSNWTSCSQTCGGRGKISRSRVCNRVPNTIAKDCPGAEKEKKNCFVQSCSTKLDDKGDLLSVSFTLSLVVIIEVGSIILMCFH